MDEPHPTARRLLQFVAWAEIAALALESLYRRYDEADAKALRDQLQITTKLAEDMKSRLPRQISEAGIEALREALGKYPIAQVFR